MCLRDIYFLGVYVLERVDLDHLTHKDGTVEYRDWLYERCMEVQAEPDGFIDIWANGDHTKQQNQSDEFKIHTMLEVVKECNSCYVL